MRYNKTQDIIELVRQCNNLGQAKLGALFIKENMRIVLEMLNPCENEAQFVTKIASLSSLFNVDLTPLRNLVKKPPNTWRSIKLIEKWLQDSIVTYNLDMIQTWANIVSLRNMEPIHETDPIELKRILNFFNVQMRYPLDYSGLWDEILEMFKLSLNEWRDILNIL